MTKKSKWIWRIVKTITLALPLPVFLFLSATLFSITPDYVINADISSVSVVEYEDAWFIYSDDISASYDGLVRLNGEIDKYGMMITSDDVIKINKDYYSYQEQDGVYQLVDVKRLEVQKQQSYKLPISFFISLIGALVVVLIVQKKMNWHKEHPKGAVMIALITGTVILYVIQLIVSSVLGVFVVATASWGAYLLEDMLQQGQITNEKQEKHESDIIRALRQAVGK
jgi:hypothetical protein